jgi:RNase H-fold protein (predicted Holliday junction resolvase)
MSKRARGFAKALEDAIAAAGLDAAVHLVDERGTSKAAAFRLAESAVKKSKRKALLDSEAARIMAEDFVMSRPRG